MRLRPKLIVAFFLHSTLVCVLLAVFLCHFVNERRSADFRARLGGITHLGAKLIDRGAFDELRAKISKDLDGADARAVERSRAYRKLSEQLNAIRNAEPELVRFVYIVAPTEDPDHPRYVADADALSPDSNDVDASSFNKQSPVAAVPGLKRALLDCEMVVETEYVRDPIFNVDSISAYVPLGGSKGNCAGILGVDVIDGDMQAVLAATRTLAIRASLVVMGLALIISVALGATLTRPILTLSAMARRLAGKDFTVRTAITSQDEIGQLGLHVNAMADTLKQHSENLEQLVRQRMSELYAKTPTAERLLLNVVPAATGEQDGEVVIDRYDKVSVLFADFIGFNRLSLRATPGTLLTVQHQLFGIFDRMAEKHRLEKVRTIGGAYIVVAGVPQPTDDHALAVARMALEMLTEVRKFANSQEPRLNIRIGIHTGPVVAGVVGTKRFIYDLWGDTVNVASRVESRGFPGHIHVTEAVFECLRDVYRFESCKPLEIKGKRPMPTYRLSPDPLVQTPGDSWPPMRQSIVKP